MKLTFNTIILTAFIGIVFTSCCSQKKNSTVDSTVAATTSNPNDLDKNDWKLSELKIADRMETVKDSKAFVRFQTGNGSAGGNASCNRFGAKLSTDKNKIQFKDIFSTKMFCEGVQATENSFLEALGKVDRFEITHGQLRLFRENDLLIVLNASAGEKTQN